MVDNLARLQAVQVYVPEGRDILQVEVATGDVVSHVPASLTELACQAIVAGVDDGHFLLLLKFQARLECRILFLESSEVFALEFASGVILPALGGDSLAVQNILVDQILKLVAQRLSGLRLGSQLVDFEERYCRHPLLRSYCFKVSSSRSNATPILRAYSRYFGPRLYSVACTPAATRLESVPILTCLSISA